MITVEIQMEIEAPPETVFDLLADHTKHPLWNPNIIEASLFAEGPIKKGSKGISVGESNGRRIENEIIYSEYGRPASPCFCARLILEVAIISIARVILTMPWTPRVRRRIKRILANL